MNAGWIPLAALGLYAGCGVIFALAFALRGAARVDPAAGRGTWGFRLLIVPAAAALWPLLAARWVRRGMPPASHTDPAPSIRRTATRWALVWPLLWLVAVAIVVIGARGRGVGSDLVSPALDARAEALR